MLTHWKRTLFALFVFSWAIFLILLLFFVPFVTLRVFVVQQRRPNAPPAPAPAHCTRPPRSPSRETTPHSDCVAPRCTPQTSHYPCASLPASRAHPPERPCRDEAT